jgi:hypothetical protein
MGSDKTFIDIPISGTVANTGKPGLLYNNDALSNAFQIWVGSTGTDSVRSKKGGYIIKHLGKPLTNERANDIQGSIKLGIKEDFKPELKIIKLEVEALKTIRMWRIKLIAYSPILQIGINNEFYLRNNS